MKRILMAGAVLLMAGSPAWAWDNTNHGHNNQIVDGGPGAQANSNQRQTANGGAGGSATGGMANARGGNVSINGGVGSGGGGGNDGLALGVSSPSASGTDCPVIGPGIGGQSGLSAGIFSWGYLSPDCNKRRTVDVLYHLYGPAVARAYAEQNIKGVSEAVALANSGNHTDPLPGLRVYKYDWCWTRDAGNVAQRRVCETK